MDKRQQCAARRAQGEAAVAIPQSSVGSEESCMAQAPNVRGSASVSPSSVSSRVAKKASEGQRKEDRGKDER